MKNFIIILFFLPVVLFSSDFIFGVVPQQSPVILNKKWRPLINYLSQQTHHNFILRFEKSIPEFEKNLYAGVYDIAYMNPFHYVQAKEKMGYDAKVRAKKMIRGILVSKEKYDIHNEDLSNKTFLFPAPNAFAATLLTKYELNKFFGFSIEKNKKYKYVNSHDSVYKGVARGVGDIGGGIERTFNNFSDIKSKEKLHIIYKTQKYPSHPIAMHKRLSEDDVKVLKNILLNIPPELLLALSIKELVPTTDEEYDNVKELSHYFKNR